MINQVMYYGGMIFAIVMGIVTIILFFAWRIPGVIGDLTGINAKRAINRMSQNQSKEKKRGISAKLGNSREINVASKTNETIVLSEDKTEPLSYDDGSEQTQILFQNDKKIQFSTITDERCINSEIISKI